jgi:hypothetical protein
MEVYTSTSGIDGTHSQQDRSFLNRMIEVTVLRLYLFEMGEPVGNHLTVERV